MTHDELLAKVDESNAYYPSRMAQMVYAVLELHKSEFMIASAYCIECTSDEKTISYPCPTIQAIEKELR
jgi:hypothetical protein